MNGPVISVRRSVLKLEARYRVKPRLINLRRFSHLSLQCPKAPSSHFVNERGTHVADLRASGAKTFRSPIEFNVAAMSTADVAKGGCWLQCVRCS